MSAILIEQHWISAPQGQLFAQTWTPSVETGSPIVLLHDSLGSVALWRDFPEQLALACSRKVIAYDRLGFGKSDVYPGDLRADFVHAEANSRFESIRHHFGLDSFVLVGHSVGGAMAICCAALHQGSCEAVISISAQAFVDGRILAGIESAKAGFEQPGQLEKLAKYHGSKAAWVLGAWVNTWSSEAFRTWSLDEFLPRVVCPLMCIHGDRDEYGSSAHPNQLVSLAGGPTSLHVLSDCGHLPHREQPSNVLQLISEFLR